MKPKTLEKANNITMEIDTLKRCIKQFDENMDMCKDGNYYLNISRYTDGSGKIVDLAGATTFNGKLISFLKGEMVENLRFLEQQFEEL